MCDEFSIPHPPPTYPSISFSPRLTPLPRPAKPARRDALGQPALTTTIHALLIGRELNEDLAADPEDVVKIKVAARRGGHAIDGHVGHVRRRVLRDRAPHGLGVVVDGGDGRAGVEVAVVDGIGRDEGRDDEEVGCGWD